MGWIATVVKSPIHAYRWTLKPLIGLECRHLPTCSDYALQSIDRNGAWRGLWLTLSRLSRCHPWGSAGYDPPPDITRERHALAPWRYGRWRMPKNDHTCEGGEHPVPWGTAPAHPIRYPRMRLKRLPASTCQTRS